MEWRLCNNKKKTRAGGGFFFGYAMVLKRVRRILRKKKKKRRKVKGFEPGWGGRGGQERTPIPAADGLAVRIHMLASHFQHARKHPDPSSCLFVEDRLIL